jgi:GTP cyclohydrolase II
MSAHEYIGPIHLPLDWGTGEIKGCELGYYGFPGGRYLVTIVGDIHSVAAPLVRIQSACSLGDLFGSRWCDCQWQFNEAKRRIFDEGVGLLVYCFDQHGKGIGLRNHFQVYAHGQKHHQELLTETFEDLGLPKEMRSYAEIKALLVLLRLKNLRLMTNDPERLRAVSGPELEVSHVPLEPPLDDFNREELFIKKREFGHLLGNL